MLMMGLVMKIFVTRTVHHHGRIFYNSDARYISCHLSLYTELGTRQLFSSATTITRQRNRAARTSKKFEKYLGLGGKME